MSRPIELDADDLAKLSPEVRERIEGNALPVPRRRRAASVDAAAGRQRGKTGRDFEGELDQMHTWYEFQKIGKIRRNHAPTKVVRKRGERQRVAVGGAHVDRTGWVRVERKLIGGPPYLVACADPTRGTIIPIAFDAKVLGASARGLYRHEVDRQHQLHDLREAARVGEVAFLLVLAPDRGRLFGLEIGAHFDALISGQGVRLWDAVRWLVPSIGRTRGPGPIGWDWLQLLPALIPDPRAQNGRA